MDNIPVINGIESHMNSLDLLKWKHYSTKDHFIFQLTILKDRTLSMNIVMNGSNIIDSVGLNKQEIDLQMFLKIQFSANCPIISCKYFSHDSMLNLCQRRFQMTLKDESDFNGLTNILRQMGFIVKNAKLLSNKVAKESHSLNSIPGNIVSPLIESSFISASKDNLCFKHLKTKTDVDEPALPLLETQTKSFAPRSITYHSDKFIVPNTNIPGIFSNVTEQSTSLIRVGNSEMNKDCLQDNLHAETFCEPTGLIKSNSEATKDNKNKSYYHSVSDDLDKGSEKGQDQARTHNATWIQKSTSDQNQKQVTSPDVVLQEESRNIALNDNGINYKKKLKKKVHITRKLIKTKLKDKKFRKWVCINYH